MNIQTTKGRILSTSRTLFAKKGFDATSMSDIASKVGIQKSSLYYFFKNKETIYTEIIIESTARVHTYLESIEAKETHLDFSEIIEQLLTINMTDTIVAHMLDRCSINTHSALLKKIHKRGREIQELFQRICIKYGVEDPDVAMEVTLNAIHAYTVHAAFKKATNITPKQYATYLAKLIKS
jgi:AcrR family transcriptional regulator